MGIFVNKCDNSVSFCCVFGFSLKPCPCVYLLAFQFLLFFPLCVFPFITLPVLFTSLDPGPLISVPLYIVFALPHVFALCFLSLLVATLHFIFLTSFCV